MNDCRFDYYYGMEADQFQFYRIPKVLIKDERFRGISCEAKMAYGLMLDRMSLSMKNQWFDEQNRVYIIYKLSELMDDLCCGKDKAVNIMAELEQKVGLIERVKRGLGRPDIIYVKNFTKYINDFQTSEKANTQVQNQSAELYKTELLCSEKQTSVIRDNSVLDVDFSGPKKNEVIHNNINNNQSINQSKNGVMDGIDAIALEKYIKKIMDYENLISEDSGCPDVVVEEMYQLVFDICYQQKGYVRVNGNDMPIETVKSRFMKLTRSNVEYVIDNILNTTTKIKNMRAYMITALYNSFTSFNTDIFQQVQHDMYGGGWYEKGIL